MSARGIAQAMGQQDGTAVITIVGEMHRTDDGRSFFVDYAELIPKVGAYDVVMFGLRRAGHDDFQMGVAFPQESASVSGAQDSLVREGLVHLRARLDQGTEEDGSLIEIPSNVFGGWRPSFRISVRPRTRRA